MRMRINHSECVRRHSQRRHSNKSVFSDPDDYLRGGFLQNHGENVIVFLAALKKYHEKVKIG